QRYNRAGRAEQDQMLRDYVEARLKNDPSILAAGEAVRQEEAVVPVTLDLGLVLLRRAQAGGGAGRQAELEKAEKVFLSIRDVAGESDQYRLYLAQVYYWLGKHAQGRKLFDEGLAGPQRDADILLLVRPLLREGGALPQSPG